MTDGLISWMSSRLIPNESLLIPQHPATNVYQTKDGIYITLSIAFEQHFWRNLCRAINREDLNELTLDDWQVRAEELYQILQDKFLSKTCDEWIQILTDADVPHGPVYTTPEEVLGDPQFQHRGMLVEAEDEEGRKVKQVGSPLKSFSMPVKASGRPPRLGEHTEEILRSLGYNQKEIEELKKEGVV
jgi:crotonobetainyl-CoA:carnitine CoA-transferase CaiB-like acyl-CoA transferase